MGQVMQGFDCDVLLSSLPSLGAFNEPMTNAGDNKTYQITASAHRYLDDTQPFTLQMSADGVTAWTAVPASTVYKVQWPIGTVVFAVPQIPSFIRASTLSYFTVSSVGDAYGWTLTLVTNKQDVTPFQQFWHSKVVTIKDATSKITTYRFDDLFAPLLGNKMVLILYADKTVGTRWICYATLDGDDVKSATTGIVATDISFDCQGEVFFLAV